MTDQNCFDAVFRSEWPLGAEGRRPFSLPRQVYVYIIISNLDLIGRLALLSENAQKRAMPDVKRYNKLGSGTVSFLCLCLLPNQMPALTMLLHSVP